MATCYLIGGGPTALVKKLGERFTFDGWLHPLFLHGLIWWTIETTRTIAIKDEIKNRETIASERNFEMIVENMHRPRWNNH